MKFKINDLVTYSNKASISCFRVIKVFPNFRQKNLKGYAIQVEDLSSCFHGQHWASVKEESIEHFNNIMNTQKTKQTSIIATKSTMSNLVGMWAFIWADAEQNELKQVVFIYGKADEDHYIIQAINPLTGEPNIAKLKTINQMKDWTFISTAELVNELRLDLERNKTNRYRANF